MSIIKIIVASTRDGRFGIQPANLLHKLAEEQADHEFELVDLKDHELPFFRDAVPPSAIKDGQYSSEAVRNWAKVIGEADGFIFVVPEYNHSIPAEFKNAIDSIAAEWHNKPVAYVSYGTEAGGSRSVEHLRAGLAWLGMYDIKDHLTISNYWAYLDENGTFQPTDKHLDDARRVIDRIGFWTEEFKLIRSKLAKRMLATA